METRPRIWCLAAGAAVGLAVAVAQEPPPPAKEERVGPGPEHVVTPDNHWLTPAGRQVDLPGMRPQGIAISPDGKLLVVAGSTAELVVLDPADGRLVTKVPLPAETIDSPQPVSEMIQHPDPHGALAYTGLVFSPDGKNLYLSNVNGSIKVFAVDEAGGVAPSFTIPLPPTGNGMRAREIPAGLAVSKDGSRLYAALSFSNKLAEIDAATGKLLRSWDTGMLPYGVVLLDNKAYVSNWAGRQPDGETATGPAGMLVPVRVDPRTCVAAEGSVTVVDLKQGVVAKQILTGKHAAGMALSPDGKRLVVANAAADFLSVIDTATDEATGKIWPKKTPADLFGAAPNAVVFAPDGKHLYVCNGTQNAVAVVNLVGSRPELEGLIPTAWYPGAIMFDASRNQLCVANIKGLGGGVPVTEPDGKVPPKQKFNTLHPHGIVSLIPLPPDAATLAAHTAAVLRNHRAPLIAQALAKPRPGRAPQPVPERAGEPSVFRHVVYIIKENRTYDQVLGDMPEGDGDPALCVFGAKVTPNQHQLARDFVLLDNAYCSGVLSADGHNWCNSAITTDYLEKSFDGFPRSYPDGSKMTNSDAMAWSPAGFLWDAALANGKTVRIYGEFTDTKVTWKDPGRKAAPTWLEAYHDWQEHNDSLKIVPTPIIASLKPHVCPDYPSWGKMIPDQYRASVFLSELAQWEQNGNMPNLMVLTLPIDHTNGTVAGFPVPAAQVADNDLAFGRIVEGLSRSKFWQDTCVIAIEDDPQNGWDHVSAFRTTAYVASAYSRLKRTVHTQYNQTSVVRTIELILGLPPMNELDATATPMEDCFLTQPNMEPWHALPAETPLDQLNPKPGAIKDRRQRAFARESARLPLDRLDACSEDTLNHILWHAAKPRAPYPLWAAGDSGDDDG